MSRRICFTSITFLATIDGRNWTTINCVYTFANRRMAWSINRLINVWRCKTIVCTGRLAKIFPIWNCRSVRRNIDTYVDKKSKWKKVERWTSNTSILPMSSFQLDLNNRSATAMIIGIVVTSSFLILILFIIIGIFCCRRRKQRLTSTRAKTNKCTSRLFERSVNTLSSHFCLSRAKRENQIEVYLLLEQDWSIELTYLDKCCSDWSKDSRGSIAEC